MIELSLPARDVRMVEGMRTYPVGHAPAWRSVCAERRWSRAYGYEFFPRGRVNQVKGGEYLLLADASIFRAGWAEQVIERFNLDPAAVCRGCDPHYRTNRLTTLFR